MASLTGKFMEESLKKGFTTSECAKRLGYTEEEFLSRLKFNFAKRPYNEMLAKLKANDKKAERELKRKSKKNSTLEISENQNIVQDSIDISSEDTSIKSTENITSNSENSLTKTSSEIQTLLEERKKIEDELNTFEVEHKQLTSERSNIRNLISSSKEKLIALSQEVKKQQEELTKLSKELDIKLNKMHELNEKITDSQNSLLKINEKIQNAIKIEICIYSTGCFEVVSGRIAIEDILWDDFFKELISSPEVETLTVKQIKTLAKSLCIAKFLTDQNKTFEFIFEEKEVEQLFNLKKNS